jgi:hypothetical protein
LLGLADAAPAVAFHQLPALFFAQTPAGAKRRIAEEASEPIVGRPIAPNLAGRGPTRRLLASGGESLAARAHGRSLTLAIAPPIPLRPSSDRIFGEIALNRVFIG